MASRAQLEMNQMDWNAVEDKSLQPAKAKRHTDRQIHTHTHTYIDTGTDGDTGGKYTEKTNKQMTSLWSRSAGLAGMREGKERQVMATRDSLKYPM